MKFILEVSVDDYRYAIQGHNSYYSSLEKWPTTHPYSLGELRLDALLFYDN